MGKKTRIICPSKKLFHRWGASGELGPKFHQGDGQISRRILFCHSAPDESTKQFPPVFQYWLPKPILIELTIGRGDFIMVHGSNVSVGCMAMTNNKIEGDLHPC